MRFNWKRALLAGLPALAAGLAGGVFTGPAIPGWYVSLNKPSFSPPNWLFGPVWTVLYAMMAIALYRILALAPDIPGRSRALVSFVGQLILNAAWPAVFFGLKALLGGVLVIIPLLGLILLTIMLFRPLDRVAAALLVPYAAWVTFAAALNIAFWRLN
jgi:tryptophan-rich sensory protein